MTIILFVVVSFSYSVSDDEEVSMNVSRLGNKKQGMTFKASSTEITPDQMRHDLSSLIIYPSSVFLTFMFFTLSFPNILLRMNVASIIHPTSPNSYISQEFCLQNGADAGSAYADFGSNA